MSEDDDLKDVRVEEGQRGRRPIDIEARRRKNRLLKAFREALELQDEDLFKEAIIHDLGQLPGSPEYQHSLRVWRDFCKRRGR